MLRRGGRSNFTKFNGFSSLDLAPAFASCGKGLEVDEGTDILNLDFALPDL